MVWIRKKQMPNSEPSTTTTTINFADNIDQLYPTTESDVINYSENIYPDGAGKKKVISYEKLYPSGDITKYRCETYLNCVLCGRDMSGSRFSNYHWCYNCFLKKDKHMAKDPNIEDFCLISSSEEEEEEEDKYNYHPIEDNYNYHPIKDEKEPSIFKLGDKVYYLSGKNKEVKTGDIINITKKGMYRVMSINPVVNDLTKKVYKYYKNIPDKIMK